MIEVSDATLRRDRGIKLRSYARAGIRVYWIVDLAGRSVEVYTEPSARGPVPGYVKKHKYSNGANVPVVINERKIG